MHEWFHARPYTTTDTVHVERNHTCIRNVAFNGKNFDRSTPGQDVMTSHVNNHARASLMKGDTLCHTSYKRFVFKHGEDVSRKPGIVTILLGDHPPGTP